MAEKSPKSRTVIQAPLLLTVYLNAILHLINKKYCIIILYPIFITLNRIMQDSLDLE